MNLPEVTADELRARLYPWVGTWVARFHSTDDEIGEQVTRSHYVAAQVDNVLVARCGRAMRLSAESGDLGLSKLDRCRRCMGDEPLLDRDRQKV